MIRLFVTQDLKAGLSLEAAPEQAHYLVNVMRLAVGDELRLFNGRDGEWAAALAAALAAGGKRGATLAVTAQTRPQTFGPDLELVVALVRRARLETIVEKAAELGARRVRLTITERTTPSAPASTAWPPSPSRPPSRPARLDAPAVEAPQKLDRLLADWPADRPLMFCDEAAMRRPALDALAGRPVGPWAVLIGPEGGFSPKVRALIGRRRRRFRCRSGRASCGPTPRRFRRSPSGRRRSATCGGLELHGIGAR